MVFQGDSFGVLCEDVLVDILCRLPARDVLKCKCVSKEWRNLVSHICVPRLSDEAPVSGVYYRAVQDKKVSYIITSCSQEQLHHLMAYNESESKHYICSASLTPINPNGPDNVFAPCSAEMSLESLLPFDHRGPNFLDCCNGLVLFVHPPKPRFYVCNPTIRQCVAVALPPPSIHLSSLYASLAFDPSESIEYRVLISTITSEHQRLHVFHSQTGEWKTHEVQIELPTSAKSFRLIRHSIYLKNTVYRLSMFYKIVCFDLKYMKARVLNCPSQKSPPSHRTVVDGQPPPGCIGISNGLLSYVTDEDGYVCVWLRDNPNKSCEWSLIYKICSRYLWEAVTKLHSFRRVAWLRVCGVHPTDNILFLSSATLMFTYHMGSGQFRRFRYAPGVSVMHCGFFFPVFMQKCIYVTVNNWRRGRGITAKIENYEDIHDPWCYIE